MFVYDIFRIILEYTLYSSSICSLDKYMKQFCDELYDPSIYINRDKKFIPKIIEKYCLITFKRVFKNPNLLQCHISKILYHLSANVNRYIFILNYLLIEHEREYKVKYDIAFNILKSLCEYGYKLFFSLMKRKDFYEIVEAMQNSFLSFSVNKRQTSVIKFLLNKFNNFNSHVLEHCLKRCIEYKHDRMMNLIFSRFPDTLKDMTITFHESQKMTEYRVVDLCLKYDEMYLMCSLENPDTIIEHIEGSK
jgi:hypothetical protein